MSIHKRNTASGIRYQVKWRENGKAFGRTFQGEGALQAAKIFDAEITKRKSQGDLAAYTGGRETLDHFVENTWKPIKLIDLAQVTKDGYAWLWGKYVGPEFGETPLRKVRAEQISRWRARLLDEGRGPRVVHDAVQLLGAVLELAVEMERLPANPSRKVKNPLPRPSRGEVRPLIPSEIEALRAVMTPRDSAAVAAMAYAGLRPGECWNLTWNDIRERTIRVHSTKTKSSRSVPIRPEVERSLNEWKKVAPKVNLVFPDSNGNHVSKDGYKSWTRTDSSIQTKTGAPVRYAGAFGRAVVDAGLGGITPNVTPYTLRHSCASLLLHEGRSVIEVARWMGHSPIMTLQVYGHVMDDLVGAGHIDGDELIGLARNADRLLDS